MSKTYKPLICGKEVEIPFIRSKAIKAYCSDCSAGERSEVTNCIITTCPLYPFRGFVNWNQEKRVLTDEQKAKVRAQFTRNKE
jgi:hypothetical protein